MYYALALVITLFYVLFYFEEKERAYVPKRLRLTYRSRTWEILEHLIRHMTLAFRHIFTKCATRVENWKTTSVINKRRSIARKYHHAMGNNAPPWQAHKRGDILVAQAALMALQAKQDPLSKWRDLARLEDDSMPLGVDNRATAFMSGEVDDFEGQLNETNKVVKGFGGSRTTGAKTGTARI